MKPLVYLFYDEQMGPWKPQISMCISQYYILDPVLENSCNSNFITREGTFQCCGTVGKLFGLKLQSLLNLYSHPA